MSEPSITVVSPVVAIHHYTEEAFGYGTHLMHHGPCVRGAFGCDWPAYEEDPHDKLCDRCRFEGEVEMETDKPETCLWCRFSMRQPHEDCEEEREEALDILEEVYDGTREVGVGKGWEAIVLHAIRACYAIDPHFKVSQIKEKFGGLRLYYSGESNQTVSRIVAWAETECWLTCEACGTHEGVTNKPRKDGYWYKTYCRSCRGVWEDRAAALLG